MEKNLKGQLLIANPKVADSFLDHSVFLLVNQSDQGIMGLCINKPYHNGAMFNNVMLGMGMNSDYHDIPLYFGGIEIPNRVFIVHSLDWGGMTTVELTNEIGFTTDVSIMAALSENQGPEYFRPCVGFTKWNQVQLEAEIDRSMWSITTATMDICFGTDDEDIWRSALNFATKQTVNHWF